MCELLTLQQRMATVGKSNL